MSILVLILVKFDFYFLIIFFFRCFVFRYFFPHQFYNIIYDKYFARSAPINWREEVEANSPLAKRLPIRTQLFHARPLLYSSHLQQQKLLSFLFQNYKTLQSLFHSPKPQKSNASYFKSQNHRRVREIEQVIVQDMLESNIC